MHPNYTIAENATFSLNEILVECVDALRHICWDNNIGSVHIAIVDEALSNHEIDSELRTILLQVISEFKQGRRHPFENESVEHLASQLESWMDVNGATRYVYHGTTSSRLRSIHDNGLCHDAVSNWEKEYVSPEHCSSNVFFDVSWRGALGWAEKACLNPEEDNPVPAVIRLPMKGLKLQKDSLALSEGTLMVQGAVMLSNPYVIVGRISGFPAWKQLGIELLSSLKT